MTTLRLDSEEPGQLPAAGAVAVVTLLAGTMGGSHGRRVILPSTTVSLDSDGNGSLEVVPNEAIEPDGTVYECRVRHIVRTVLVPDVDEVSWADPEIQVVPPEVVDWEPIRGPQGDAGPGVPDGGTEDQVLTKASNDDFDTEWADPAAPLPDGGAPYEVLTKSSAGDGDTAWALPGVRGNNVLLGANQANTNPTQAVAIGANARVNTYGIAVGYGAQAATGTWSSIALGQNTVCGNQLCVALGQQAQAGAASQPIATAIGFNTRALHGGSVALGSKADQSGGAATTATNQIMLGTAAHTVTTPGTVDFRQFSPEMIDALKTKLGLT